MATATTTTRPPVPPFTRESAMQKVRLAEDGWKHAIRESSSGIRDRFTLAESLGVRQWAR